MVKKPTFSIGDTVEVEPKHWLRPRERGKIMAIKGHKFLVKFEHVYEGGGLEGCGLYMNEEQISKL